MFELLTWGQLGLHKKPIGLLNVKFWDPLVACIDKMVESNLLRYSHRNMLIVGNDLPTLFEAMKGMKRHTRQSGWKKIKYEYKDFIVLHLLQKAL